MSSLLKKKLSRKMSFVKIRSVTIILHLNFHPNFTHFFNNWREIKYRKISNQLHKSIMSFVEISTVKAIVYFRA